MTKTSIVEELRAQGYSNAQDSSHAIRDEAYDIGRTLSQLQD